MTSSRQSIPLGECTRLTLDVTAADLVVTWHEDLDTIMVDSSEVAVDRSGDEIFLEADFSGFHIVTGDEETEIRITGLESPGKMVEDILKRTGLFSGIGRPRSRTRLNVELPHTITFSSIEIEHGSLRLVNPWKNVECTMKRSDFSSDGGEADLDLSGGSGKIRVSNLSGSLRVAGGSGDVSLIDVNAVTNVAAGSGEVTLHRVVGEAIKIAAGSGDITVKHSRSEAYASDCGSGDIVIEGGAFGRMAVRAGSGDINCSARFGNHDQAFTTGSGTVTLGVPKDVSARIEAFTSSGDIKTDLPLVSVGQRGPKSRRSARQVGSVGNADERAEVSVRTSSGDINIHWLSAAESEAIPMPPPVPDAPAPPDSPAKPGAKPSTSPANQDMDTKAVLEALASGRISVEEAEALLGSLPGSQSD